MGHKNNRRAFFELVHQSNRLPRLSRPVTTIPEKRIQRRPFRHLTHVHSGSGIHTATPLTAEHPRVRNTMVRQKRLPRPRLLTTDVVQIPLGAAIVDIKVARITGSRCQCVTQHQNRPSLSQGLPGFFDSISSFKEIAPEKVFHGAGKEAVFVIENIDALGELRVGTLYGHEHAHAFIGIASQHGGGSAILTNISAETLTMSVIDWQPEEDAKAVAYSFSHEGEYFAILDDKGFLTLLEAHEEEGDTHWEFAHKIDVASASAADLGEDQAFSMSASMHRDAIYVTDPVAQTVITVDAETETAETLLTLDFVPDSAVWLGIAESHDHDDDHNHD